jgi:general secretion pathway protein B
MSFILDALKKSEDERLGQSGPNLAYAPTGSKRDGIPRWVIILSVLLLINLAGLTAVLIWKPTAQESRPEAGQQSQTQPKVEPTPQATRQPTAQQSSASPVAAPANTQALKQAPEERPGVANNEVRPLAQEARDDMVTNTKDLTTQLPDNQAPPEAGISTVEAKPTASPSAPPPARVPTLNEMLGEGRMMNLQSLSLDLHVYAARREDRFVFINLSKYLEGQQLKEGPVVDEITNNGVILRYQGDRFLLPRN